MLLLAVPATAAAKVPADFFGVSVYAPTTQDFGKMSRGGVGAVRLPINWRTVQSRQGGPFNWAGFDNRFRQIAGRGMRVKPVLFGTPDFIATGKGGVKPPIGNKKGRKGWQRFVSAAVARYGRGGSFWRANPALPQRPVDDWIVWNEQNARAYWLPKASPRQYARMIRISHRAIGGADPKGKLIVGGMYGYSPHPKSMPAKRYLRNLYRQKKMRKLIDGVAIHPYAGGIKGVKKQVRNARQVMRRAGDRKAKLVIAEIGWASAGDRRSEFVKTRSKQRKLIARSMKLFVNNRRKWKVAGVYVYLWRDFKQSGDTCRWCPRAGLVNVKGKAKPSWNAYKRVVRSSR